MATDFETYRFIDRKTELSAAEFNRRFQSIHLRLNSLEVKGATWDGLVNEGITVALERIDDALTPAFAKVQAYQQAGFLLANSGTSLDLTANAFRTFIIADLVQRELFTPSRFLAVTRDSTERDYAIALLIGWNSVTGELQTQILTQFGGVGPFDDWVISGLPGSVPAQFTLMEKARADAKAAREATGHALRSLRQTCKYRAHAQYALVQAEKARRGAEAAATAAELFIPASYQLISEKNAANGYAGLNSSSQVTADAVPPADTANGNGISTTQFARRVAQRMAIALI